MAFLDLFKKKKKGRKEEKREMRKRFLAKKAEKKKPKPKAKPEVKKVEKIAKEKKPVPVPRKRKAKEIKVAPRVLRAPQITEKASILAERNQYVFKVAPNAPKPEIKKAIEEIYGVDVLKVRTINVPKRQRRLGRSQGWKAGYKKAIVSVRKGQSIEVLPR